MGENIQTEDTIEEFRERLQEITQIQFGVLSDDALLRFLAERKRLSVAVFEYERMQKEETDRLEREKKKVAQKVAEKKRVVILEKIKKLNKSITSDKKDDDLLALVSGRRILETELETINREFPPGEEFVEEESIPPVVVREKVSSEKKPSEMQATPLVFEEEIPKVATVPTAPEIAVKIVEEKEDAGIVPEVVLSEAVVPKEESFGNEKIRNDGIEENSEFNRYFDQLKNNTGSLGEFLQQMPVAAKKNKAFMLRVAKVDPAYAMHYADKDTLKKDEDFNMRIASFDNPRNSGNALSEMLPEARTSKVILAAVKQDYRNIKFIQPDMAHYDEIIDIAKKAVLEKVKNLKEATDISLLIPKLLQKDKQFMLLVEGSVVTVKNQ